MENIEKIIYSLFNLSLPIVTDNLEKSNFYFLIFKKFSEEIKSFYPLMDLQNIFFLASLQSMRYLDLLKLENELNLKNKSCNCLEQLERIEKNIKSLLNLVDEKNTFNL